MSLFKMTTRRVKKVLAWIFAIAIIGLLLLGTVYVADITGMI